MTSNIRTISGSTNVPLPLVYMSESEERLDEIYTIVTEAIAQNNIETAKLIFENVVSRGAFDTEPFECNRVGLYGDIGLNIHNWRSDQDETWAQYRLRAPKEADIILEEYNDDFTKYHNSRYEIHDNDCQMRKRYQHKFQRTIEEAETPVQRKDSKKSSIVDIRQKI